jgi:hypothetical protein
VECRKRAAAAAWDVEFARRTRLGERALRRSDREPMAREAEGLIAVLPDDLIDPADFA